MYLKTFLLIVLTIGIVQAKVYRKLPSLWARAREELGKQPQAREEFKCYSCHTNKKENCVKRERVCKQEEPICLEIIGVYGYVLQCSDMEYYNQATQDCEDFCEVEYCTESLCNDPDN